MTYGGRADTAQTSGLICIIIPKMNQIMIRLGNSEVLKTLTKTLTFVDAANANTEGSTIAPCERWSGELIIMVSCVWNNGSPLYF